MTAWDEALVCGERKSRKLLSDQIEMHLVDRAKTTFPNFICSIKVVCRGFDLSDGKYTSQ